MTYGAIALTFNPVLSTTTAIAPLCLRTSSEIPSFAARLANEV
jgi:hypothetical protein